MVRLPIFRPACGRRDRLSCRPPARLCRRRRATVARFIRGPGYHGFYTAIWAFAPALIAAGALGASSRPRLQQHRRRPFRRAMLRRSDFDRAIFIRDARALAENALFGTSTPEKEAAPSSIASLWATGDTILAAVAPGPRRSAASSMRGARSRSEAHAPVRRALRHGRAHRLLGGGDPDDAGHRAVADLRSIRFFEKVPFFAFLFGTHWSPQSAFVGRRRRRSSANAASLRRHPAFRRHAPHHLHRHAGRGADRADVGDLSLRLRLAPLPRRSPSRSSRCSPAFRRWSTGSSPR